MALVAAIAGQPKGIEGRSISCGINAGFDPPTHPTRMIFVRRIADANLNVLLALDRISLLPLLGDQLQRV